MAHVSYSDAGSVGDAAFNPEEIPPFQSQEPPVLESAAGNSFVIAMEEKQEGKQEEHQPPSAAVDEEVSALELKKKRFLEEVESILLPKEEKDSFCVGPSSLGLGFEVIDETALVETVPFSVRIPKKLNKQSRRRAAKKKDDRSVIMSVPKNRKYSRKEMEALRFVNVTQQRIFWKSIYARLQSPVAKEYDTLATTTHHHNPNHPQCLPNNKPAPPILSVGAANGRCRYMNVFVH